MQCRYPTLYLLFYTCEEVFAFPRESILLWIIFIYNNLFQIKRIYFRQVPKNWQFVHGSIQLCSIQQFLFCFSGLFNIPKLAEVVIFFIILLMDLGISIGWWGKSKLTFFSLSSCCSFWVAGARQRFFHGCLFLSGLSHYARISIVMLKVRVET